MDKKSKWGFSTKSIHVGNEADEALGSVPRPINLSLTLSRMVLVIIGGMIIRVFQTRQETGLKRT